MNKKSKDFSICYMSRDMVELMNQMTHFDKKDAPKGIYEYSYDFLDFPLDELAMKAKDVPMCMDEILRRYSNLVQGASRRFVEAHPGEDFDELVIYLFNVLRKAVQLYDIDKGHFENLSKSMLRLSILHFASRRSRDISTEIKYLGTRLTDSAQEGVLMDSLASPEQMSEEVKLKLDMEQYESYLDDRQKEIFSLYRLGFTYREIADKLHLSHSYVGLVLSEIIKDLIAWRQKDLI